jgi:hypothetical protein
MSSSPVRGRTRVPVNRHIVLVALLCGAASCAPVDRSATEPSKAADAAACNPPSYSGARSGEWKEWTSDSKPADGSVFSFRGNRVGDPIEKLFPCHDRRVSDVVRTNYCSSNAEIPGYRSCHDTSLMPGAGLAYMKLGDVPVDGLDYFYLDRRLTGFMLWFHTRNFPAVKNLMEAKYGTPTKVETGQVQNRAGAAFTVATLIWETPDGPMRLTSRAGRIDSGELYFMSVEGTAAAAARRKSAAKAKAPGAL